jgi:hypothetical protein
MLLAGKKLVFFIEKAGRYADTAADFTAREKGFNCKSKGQLSLRFHLPQASRAYRKGGPRLVGPGAVARFCGEIRARRLAKPDNLREIVDACLVGGEAEHYFVALTDHGSNVWRAAPADSPLRPFVPTPGAAAGAEGQDASRPVRGVAHGPTPSKALSRGSWRSP